jgi:hypothetical protein
MARKNTGRELTAEDLAAVAAGGVYRCIACGHWSKTVGESHAHKDANPACDNRTTLR